MTPILYEKDEIDFTSQGLGSLVEIYDVDVEEQRNGLLQLTASYPVSGLRYADISVGRIILAKPNQRDDVHAFRIVSTELDISGYAVTIEADSITYDLTHNLVKHLVASGNGQAFMTALKNAIVNPSIFAFYSDIATSSTTSLNYVNPMEAIMGTTGSFLQIWGGELKRENRRVAMFNRRGRDNVATFRLGKNISGLKYSVDISSLVTRIIPTKSVQNDNQTTTTLEGTPVDSKYISNYEQIYTLPLEFTDDTIKTVADLNTAAKGWFTKSANTGRDKPTVTIDIDVLSLQDSADYQDKFKNLESVSLTDTVTVYVPEYGVNVTAIVNELHYDPILNRVTKITVGTAKQSFADSSRTQLSDLQDKIISVQNQADAVAVSADGKSTNYYGSVEPSHPQEGDTWFWVNGDKSGIKQFVNGDWVDLVDSDTQEKIAASVTEAVAQANAHTTTAIEQNNASQQEVMNDIAKSQADLAIKDGDFNNKAQAMADKALADAKANTTTVAQETLNSANQNIADAKSDINDTVNALSVGGRNLLLNSRILSWGVDNNLAITTSTKVSYDSTTNMWHITSPKGGSVNAGIYFAQANNVSNLITKGQQWAFSFDIKGTGVYSQFGVEGSNPFNRLSGNIPIDWTRVSSTGTATGTNAIVIYFNSIDVALDVYIKLPKLETGTIPTDWTNAPEDVVLDYTTKDNKIKETITQYQETNDGLVSQAQTDATTALGEIEKKVSLTVYNQKTGDLTRDVAKAQTTADGAVSTVGNYKTSNDGRVQAAESKIEQNSKDITARVTKTDYDKETGKISGDISTLKQRANEFDATVTKVNGLSIGARNYWSLSGRTLGSYIEQDGTVKLSGTGLTAYNPNYFSVLPKQTIIVTLFDTDPNAPTILAGRLAYYDKDKNFLSVSGNIPITKGSYNYAVPDNVAYFRMSLFKYDDIRTKVEIGTLATDWTPAPEDIESALAQVKVTADGVSSIVSDPTTGLSTRVQTAEGILSKVKGTDIPALQNATFWQPYSSLNFNDYTKQGSFFFNASAGKTNSPTSSNAWTYLIVEQGTLDSSRIKQTAWYDGVAGVKTTYVRTLNSGTWSPWYANDNDSVTTISQTNSNVRQEIEDRKTGDSNTLQSSKEFTQSSITSAVNGVNSTISQTANGIIAQISGNNMVSNSEFSTDTDWTSKNGTVYLSLGVKDGLDGKYNGQVRVTSTTANSYQGFYHKLIPVLGGGVYSFSAKIHYKMDPNSTSGGRALFDIWFIDKDGNRLSSASAAVTVTNPYWNVVKSENVTAPATAVAVQLNFLVNSTAIGQEAWFGQIMMNTGSKVLPYVPNDSTNTTLSLLKDNWSIGINDNIGAITSGIVGNNNSMSLISKNITLDGNTTVTGDFYAKGGNFKNLNASNLTVGTLNGNQVNITNINANNIVSGAISGANLNINLNTGQVQFQKGRIFKSDYTTDINIDQGYISTANDNTRALIKQGMIQLVAPNRFDLDSSPYMELSNNRGVGTAGAAIIGRDSVSIANSKNAKNIFPAPIGTETFSGLYTGQASDGGWLPTKVAGADRGVVVSGGTKTTWQVVNSSPYIWVGSNATGSSGYGNRVAIEAEYLNAETVYYHSNSHGANVYVASDGALLKSSSATKYKTNIEHETDSIQGDQLLTIDPATWNDKFESEQLERYHEIGVEPERQINMEGKRYYGIIAEDLVKAGLEELVTRNEETDEVEGVEYSKIGVALIPIVRDLRNKLNEQAVEIERLKDKNK